MNSNNKITASELIVNRLSQLGVKQAFGVVGGAIMYITDALRKSNLINTTFVHHEQSAAIAAESYGKLCNHPSIVFATAGPGVTNTLTGIADAYMDSVPLILLVGDVRSTIAADFNKQRYNAPQEVNQGALLKPIVKHYVYLEPNLSGEQVLHEVDKAYQLAISGRMGPVCISVPLDMQGKIFRSELLSTSLETDKPQEVSFIDIEQVQIALQDAKRPMVLLGAGVRMSGAVDDVMQLIHNLDIPYCVSIGAVDLQNNSDPLSCGCVGPTSQRAANLLLHASDVILALGTSFDQSVTGFNIDDLLKNKQVFLVNIDPGEFFRFDAKAITAIVSDLKIFCRSLNHLAIEMPEQIKWLDQCGETKRILTSSFEAEMRTTCRKQYVSAYDVAQAISKNITSTTTVVLGISLDAHSVFNAFSVGGEQRVLVSRNLGPMGWDIPALLGAAYAKSHPGPLILITGDGSFMVNIQELAVIAAKKIPACIFIFNNDGYVSIRTTQANFFGNDFIGCNDETGLPIPSISGLAIGFGFEYNKLTEITTISEILKLHAIEGKPRIVECMIDPQQLREPRLVTKMENGNFRTPLVCDMTPALTQEKLKIINEILPGILDY